MSEISERMFDSIKKANMSYGELAKITGIPKSALQRYATGETEKIPIDRLERIASALNVSASYLMGWELGQDDFMKELSLDEQSGRSAAREAMIRTHGVERRCDMLISVGGKIAFLYYGTFDSRSSADAAHALMKAIEALLPEDAAHMKMIFEAYRIADDRARKLVDFALDPFLSTDTGDNFGTSYP